MMQESQKVQETQNIENPVFSEIKEDHVYKKMVSKLAFNFYVITENDVNEDGTLKEIQYKKYTQFNIKELDIGSFLYLFKRNENCKIVIPDYFIYKYIINKETQKLIPEYEGLFYQINRTKPNNKKAIVTNFYNRLVYIKFNKQTNEWYYEINFKQMMFKQQHGFMLIDYLNLPLPEVTINQLKEQLKDLNVLDNDRKLSYQYEQLFKLFKSLGKEGQSVANSYQFLIIGQTIQEEELNYEKIYNSIIEFINNYNSLEENFDNQINLAFFRRNIKADSQVFQFLAKHAFDIKQEILKESVYIQPMYYQMFLLSKYQTEQNLINFEYEANPIQREFSGIDRSNPKDFVFGQKKEERKDDESSVPEIDDKQSSKEWKKLDIETPRSKEIKEQKQQEQERMSHVKTGSNQYDQHNVQHDDIEVKHKKYNNRRYNKRYDKYDSNDRFNNFKSKSVNFQ